MPVEAKKQTLSTMLIDQWEQVCEKLAALAERVPEDRYGYRPVEEVRSFADVLRHTAFWNQCVAERAQGKEPDETANELPAAQYATKAKILQALRKSNRNSAAALRKHAHLDNRTAELLVTFIEHVSEHYGQLVVYARLKGIVPPSSAA
jgi:uncharacterized damage-inducible protein DinB